MEDIYVFAWLSVLVDLRREFDDLVVDSILKIVNQGRKSLKIQAKYT